MELLFWALKEIVLDSVLAPVTPAEIMPHPEPDRLNAELVSPTFALAVPSVFNPRMAKLPVIFGSPAALTVPEVVAPSMNLSTRLGTLKLVSPSPVP